MSTHEISVEAVCLAFTEKEMELFLDGYDKKRELNEKESMKLCFEIYKENYDISDDSLSNTTFIGCNNKEFWFTSLSEADYSLSDFIPLFYDGEYNENLYFPLDDFEPKYYIGLASIFRVLFNKDYSDPKLIMSYAKKLVGDYLPNDFDFEKHLGVISYVVFC